LWRACRSSGAAPTFFRAAGAFIDGGLIANNPCLDALTAFTKHNTALRTVGRTCQVKRLQLLLSIGTGKPPVIPAEVIDVGSLYSLNPYEPYQTALQALNLTQEMMAMATQTDAHVVERAHAWCRSTQVAYFRLNPPISENLQLNVLEESEIVNALWESKAYLHAQAEYIGVLVDMLERNV
jgi:calcium-independent phospholipase A2